MQNEATQLSQITNVAPQFIKDDLPAFGAPNKPTSVFKVKIKINSSITQTPGGIVIFGARSVEVANIPLPIPPLPPGHKINVSFGLLIDPIRISF